MQLAGLKVLLTRPEGQVQELAQAITQQGGEVTHYPVMVITALDEQQDKAIWQQSKQYIIDLDLYQHVIFISTNAVNFGMAWIEEYWPQLPVGIEWHAIGRATARALNDRGLKVP